jgi:hypothetical protein
MCDVRTFKGDITTFTDSYVYMDECATPKHYLNLTITIDEFRASGISGHLFNPIGRLKPSELNNELDLLIAKSSSYPQTFQNLLADKQVQADITSIRAQINNEK